MNLIDKLIERLKEENIPMYSMSEEQLKRSNEILKGIMKETTSSK